MPPEDDLADYIAQHTFIISDDALFALQSLAEERGIPPGRMLEVLILEAHGPVLLNKRPKGAPLRDALYRKIAAQNQR